MTLCYGAQQNYNKQKCCIVIYKLVLKGAAVLSYINQDVVFGTVLLCNIYCYRIVTILLLSCNISVTDNFLHSFMGAIVVYHPAQHSRSMAISKAGLVDGIKNYFSFSSG